MNRTEFSTLLLGMISLVLALTSGAGELSDLVAQSGIKGGLIVHLGCGSGDGTAELATAGPFVVHGLDTRVSVIAKARRNLREKGIYGRVSVEVWDGRHLPYAENLVNLIVAEAAGSVSEPEILRALAPDGKAMIGKNGEWRTVEKPWPGTMDEWTHYFHGPDGNPVAEDTLVGPPRRLQWLGAPDWARHHDHMASMTSLVSAKGRLFYIFDEANTASIQFPSRWRLIARDAFNGTILWKREIPKWNTRHYPLKSGPAHLLRRLVAVGDRVYVTLGIDQPVSVLDAATGRTEFKLENSDFSREIVVAGDRALLVTENAPSKLPSWRRVSTYVWENTRAANPGWGWHGTERTILACDTQTGKLVWENKSPVAPCSLACKDNRVVFHDGEKLICLNRQNGKVTWKSEPVAVKMPVQTNTGPRILIYEDVVLYAGNTGRMSGWSVKNGKKLWEQRKKPSGHQSLKDLYVVQGLVWTADIAGNQHSGTFTGYDPKTGEKKREFAADVKIHWFHHRCYPAKATSKYILTGRDGTEFVDLREETWDPNHWVRGGCIYGVMPCNGLTYAPMDACGCQLEAKLEGFKALAPGPAKAPTPPAGKRVQKGPAFAHTGPAAGTEDWPTHRHDQARSGSSPSTLPESLKLTWKADIRGRLSAPTIAAGKVFAASIDTHTIHAMDADAGTALWTYTAGGRIDSPPTYHRGLVIFGSLDGSVYALRADDGVLAWKFQGAPVDRRLMIRQQPESAWPVHGSVLVRDGICYCTAGRNMFLDGGIRFLKLDAATGRLITEVIWDDRDPISGGDMHLTYLKKTPGNNMPVALSDVLSCDGKHLWMRSQKIDFNGKRSEIGLLSTNEQPPEDSHLFCQAGFLDDSWFFRTYWTYGRRVSGGYGGWFKAGRVVPAGRILCFDDKQVYGYGRKAPYMVNSSVIEYQLFAANKTVTPEAIAKVGEDSRRIGRRLLKKNAVSSDWRLRYFFSDEELTAARYSWTVDQPTVTARAMALDSGGILAAGPENMIDERRAYHNPDDKDVLARLQRQQEAMEGLHGGRLWYVDKTSGKIVKRYRLDTIPVFDGMAIANGRLFLAAADGTIQCFGKKGKALREDRETPSTLKWKKKEDPDYMLPPTVSKKEDFDRVKRTAVTECKLGYRLTSSAKWKPGLAVKELDKPIAGKTLFQTKVAFPNATGMKKNGYLAFGDGHLDEKLVKCGVQSVAENGARIVIIQGPTLKGKVESAWVNTQGGKPMEMTVQVDPDASEVSITVAGKSVTAELANPPESIRYLGYVVATATADFAPISPAFDGKR